VTARIFRAAMLCGLWLSWAAGEVQAAAQARGVPAAGKPARLQVSPDNRFLVREDGTPFFWLGDTAWGCIRKAVREDAENQPSVLRYLKNRADKGFTVLQTQIVDTASAANAYGHAAFVEKDFTRPRLVDGPDNDYWDWVDWFADQGEAHGLYLALLPTWGSALANDEPIVKDPKVAYRYGRFLGARYGRRTHIIWVLGGDPWGKGKDCDDPDRLAMTRAIAEGIADGARGADNHDGQADYSAALMTYHPPGGDKSSSKYLHREPWLDFNMIQTTTRFAFTNYATVAADYALAPPKPTLDAEVAYEGSLSLKQQEPQDRRTTPWEARKAAYWNLFAGGFGHTYGHRSFISWVCKGESLRHGANVPWYENLDAPGSFQMTYVRRLMESRPFLGRVPDQSLIAEGEGQGLEHAQATRGGDRSYALVYLPTGRPVTLDLGKLSGKAVKAWWFDPREGAAGVIGEFPAQGTKRFAPPSSGDGSDWVLVLDDAAKEFPPPGSVGGR